MRLCNYSLNMGKKLLFENVSVDFPDGSISHILGGNGVGKSCLAKSLTNNLEYTGDVIFDGALCVIGSYTNVPSDLTINNLMRILQGKNDKHIFDELYNQLGIRDIDSNLKIKKMSDGQKQKVKLLVYLSNMPNVLVLDEFTSALDKKSMLEIYAFLRQYIVAKKITVLNITHNVVDLENLEGYYYYVTQRKIIRYDDKKKLLEDYVSLN